MRPVQKPRQVEKQRLRKGTARLHVELVKLQEWVVQRASRSASSSRDVTPLARAAPSRRSPSASARAFSGSLPCRRRAIARRARVYMQRYVAHLPAAGEIVIWDRSWYNRAGVERVMGFCSEEKVRRFLQGVPLFERAMVENGIILLKYCWRSVPTSRRADFRRASTTGARPGSSRRWISSLQPLVRLFQGTGRDVRGNRPGFRAWYVARSDDKKRARLNIITHILKHVPYEAFAARKGETARAAKAGRLQGIRPPSEVRCRKVLNSAPCGDGKTVADAEVSLARRTFKHFKGRKTP